MAIMFTFLGLQPSVSLIPLYKVKNSEYRKNSSPVHVLFLLYIVMKEETTTFGYKNITPYILLGVKASVV